MTAKVSTGSGVRSGAAMRKPKALERGAELVRLLGDTKVDGVIGVRGGYGSNYLLDPTLAAAARTMKAVVGFSDLTSVQIFLWQQCGWVTFYGPMVAAGFDEGAGAPSGYDEQSLRLS